MLLDAVGGPPATLRHLSLPVAVQPPAAASLADEPSLLDEEEPSVEPRRSAACCAWRCLAWTMRWSGWPRSSSTARSWRAPWRASPRPAAPTRELVQVLQENARQLRDLRAAILHLRMVRVGDVLERMPLLVRGLRRATGKQVRLELDVGDAELDKAVADRLLPALVHLVRNAVDHALERPDERRARGQARGGRGAHGLPRARPVGSSS